MKSTKFPVSPSRSKNPGKEAARPVEQSKPEPVLKEATAKMPETPKSAAAKKPVKETVRASKPEQPPKEAPAKIAEAPKRTAAKKPVKEIVQAKEPKRPKAPKKTEADIAEASTTLPVSQEQRLQMIEFAAYLRAEQRGFLPGYEAADWLAAEMEVDLKLGLIDRPK